MNNQAALSDIGSLVKMVFNLFSHWQLSNADQAILLGIDPEFQTLQPTELITQQIQQSRDQTDRLIHLLAIHKTLRLLFPKNRELAYHWMTTRNKAFESLTPFEVVKERGFIGLLEVRSYLDRFK